VEDCISFDDGGALSVFVRLGKNVVAIIVVQDYQIVVANNRRRDEVSSLVSIDLSSGLCYGAVTFESFGGVSRWSEIFGAADRVISVLLDMGALSSGSLVFCGSGPSGLRPRERMQEEISEETEHSIQGSW
jgi:hypothetical protein